MEVKPGFKRTDDGAIPNDWTVQNLSDISNIERVKFSARPRNDPRYYGGEIPFLQTGDVAKSKGRIQTYTQTLNSQGLSVSRAFPSGTLFFTIAANIGDVGIAEFSAACPDSLVAIRPKSNTHKEWLKYELTSRKKDFEQLASPGAQLNINLEKLKPYRLRHPPIKEQIAIASLLSDVDALLDSLDRLIDKKHDLKQAAMQQLLTGQTRLPGFSGEWEIKTLGQVCKITTGKKDVNEGDPNGSFPFFTCARSHTFSNSYSFEGEAVLIAGNGEVGNLSYFNGKFEAYQRTYVLQSFNLHLKYVWHQLSAHLVNSLGIGTIGSSIPYIKKENLTDFQFKAPLDKEEQFAIAQTLSDLDFEIITLQQRLNKTSALKQGMMQELLTGRTRLV